MGADVFSTSMVNRIGLCCGVIFVILAVFGSFPVTGGSGFQVLAGGDLDSDALLLGKENRSFGGHPLTGALTTLSWEMPTMMGRSTW